MQITYHLRPLVPPVTWGHTSSKSWGLRRIFLRALGAGASARPGALRVLDG